MRGRMLQGKLHETLDEHLGQLAAGMRSAREQYTRTHLGKRKFDDEGEFEQVGIAFLCKGPVELPDVHLAM